MALSGLCLGAHPVNAQEPSAVGLWQNIDPETGKPDGWFFISERNGAYEGAIVKMFLKPNDPPNPTCAKCEGDQKDAPWLGLTIIKGMARKGLMYEHGTILDPRYGTEWKALMTLSADGQDLTVRGYLAIPTFGKDQYWKRLPEACLAQLDPVLATRVKSLPVPKAGAPLPKGAKPAAAC
jgi:uncharacterized protein (DUF2147 family)